MTTEVTKLQFLHRQILVTLDDGAPWPLRIHPAVQAHFEALTAEVAELRPEAQEMAALRVQAERAGESPKDLLAGMVAKIETLAGTLAAERDATSQKIVSLQRAISAAEASGRRDASRAAVKLARVTYEHCQRHGPVEAVDVLRDVVGQLQGKATVMEAQAARMTG